MAGKEADKEKGAEAKGGKKKIIMVVPLVLLLAAGGWWFFLRGGSETTTLPAPVAGEVIEVDPITINLASGHFLKIGMGLQVVEGPHTAPSSAKALDLAISQFSGKTIAELSSAAGREKNKAELTARVKLAYAPHDDTAATTKAAEASTVSDHSDGSDSSDESEESDESSADGHGAPMTAEQAIKAADALKVQPDIYEVYFTEFVMQ